MCPGPFTLTLSACFRVFSPPVSTPRPLHHGTTVHVTSLSSPSFGSSLSQDDVTLAESILVTKGSVYCVWLPFSFLLLGSGQVPFFADDPCLFCWMDSREADRYKVVAILCDISKGASLCSILFFRPKGWGANSEVHINPYFQYYACHQNHSTQEFARSESYHSHGPVLTPRSRQRIPARNSRANKRFKSVSHTFRLTDLLRTRSVPFVSKC